MVIYLVQKKKAQAAAAFAPEEPGSGGDEIALLVRDAEAKLAAAKLEQGARVGNLPVYLLMGDPGSAKTSIMLHSGLEPELLAGQVYQADNVAPTRTANLWFSRRSVFVEAGGRLLADPAKWQHARQQAPAALLGGGQGRAGAARGAWCASIARTSPRPGAAGYAW